MDTNVGKTCDRCKQDCDRGWSERWKGMDNQPPTLAETVCLDCDHDERIGGTTTQLHRLHILGIRGGR